MKGEFIIRITVKSVCLLLVLLLGIGLFYACDKEEEAEPRKLGEFYTLQEAYEQGFITRDDLDDIAYYNEYVGFYGPYYPTALDEETANKVKETWAYNVRHREVVPRKAQACYVTIHRYLGTYNNCVVCVVKYDGDPIGFNDVVSITVEGVEFKYTTSFVVYVWVPA